MPLSDYYVPGANENPLDYSALPKTRPELKFPTADGTKGQKVLHALVVLAQVFLVSLAASLLTSTWVSDQRPAFVISGLASFFVLSLWLKTRKTPLQDVLTYVFPALLAIAVLVAGCIYTPQWVLPGIALWLLRELYLFRVHYLNRSIIGMIDRRTAWWFRWFKWKPWKLKAKWLIPSFIDAVVCFLTYNRFGYIAPGLFQSPAGRYSLRVARTVFTCVLVSLLFPLFATAILERVLATPELLILSLVGPIVALATWLIAAFAGTWLFVGKAYALKQSQMGPERFKAMLDNMASSKDQLERESIFLAIAPDGAPVSYPVSNLKTHATVNGKTGSGKTALLATLVYQLVYRGIETDLYDLKGHGWEVLAVMQQAAKDAFEKKGIQIPVKHFTLDHGNHTHLFDIFSQTWWLTLPTPQRCGVVLSSIGLNYQTSYGQSYYRDSAYALLHFVLERNPKVTSWVELAAHIQQAIRFAKSWELSRSVKSDGEHLLIIIRRLASLPSINNVGVSQRVRDNAIDFTKSEHRYFALGASKNGLIAGEVGRIALAAKQLAVIDSYMDGKQPLRVAIIDEFQELVTSDLEILLAQARSLGIGVILAHQNASQLITPDLDMRPIIEGNTSLQAWMQTTDVVGREQIRNLGGKELIHLPTFSTDPKTGEPRISLSTSVSDRVNANLISDIGAEQNKFLLRLTDNAGYACYRDRIFKAEFMFHQSRSDFDAACKMPWPAASPETLENKSVPPKSPPDDPPSATAPLNPRPNPPTKTPNKATQPAVSPPTRKRSNRLGTPKPVKNNP